MKVAMLTLLALVVVALIGLGLWLWTPDKLWAALAAKYLNAPEDMVVVEGTRLHVRDTGPHDAPTLIMIHGFGSSLQTWDGWAQALEDDFRVIRLDLPGAGLSEPDPTGDYTDQRAIALLVALMDQRGVAKASLIGNSIGGRIAWTFAARHPDRVERLVLVSPDGFASHGFSYGETPEIPAMVGLLPYVLPKALLRMNLKPAYGDPSALTDATVERYHDLLLAPGNRAAVIKRMEQTVLEPPEPLLQQIRAPVLLVWGESDAMIPVANAEDYAKSLADSTLVRLPGLGHVPQEEAPARSVLPVRAFLTP